jgi:hypothetical protein
MLGVSDEAAFAYISKIAADNDVVIGVWQEPAAPYRAGIHPIKGRRRLQAIVASRSPGEHMRLMAVPCVGRDWAVAAEQVLDDKPSTLP